MELFDILLSADAIFALITLTFLEIVLGIDNIVFITIVTSKLKESEQPRARNIGLVLAMIFRIILLFAISWVVSLKDPFFYFDYGFVKGSLTWQSVIVIAGGLFLFYKAVSEIHHKLEGDEEAIANVNGGNVQKAIMQIALLNIVFSFDSIITAIGIVSLENPPKGFGEEAGLIIMIIAVIFSIIIMIAFAGPVSRFVNKHPTLQILGLSFLILIGFMLVAEGAHTAHISFFNQGIGEIPKGYLYFAIFFSLLVEVINMKMKKNTKKPVKLRFNDTDQKLNNY